jgi:hypothetical protein
MRLVEYRLASRHRSVVDRVDLIMDEASRLIGRVERHGVGTVEIAVTVSGGMPDLICAAHEGLVGASDWDSWARSTGDGFTTLNAAGSLVIINAQLLHGRTTEIDKTVLHELMHAAQYNRPGAWETGRKVIAFDYGIGDLPDSQLRAARSREARDEREAQAAERLHRQLSRAVA